MLNYSNCMYIEKWKAEFWKDGTLRTANNSTLHNHHSVFSLDPIVPFITIITVHRQTPGYVPLTAVFITKLHTAVERINIQDGQAVDLWRLEKDIIVAKHTEYDPTVQKHTFFNHSDSTEKTA